MSKLPYGSLLFQPGEYFDCGICMKGIWVGEKVVALSCNPNHVFHADCLRSQINDYQNKFCILCDVALPVPMGILEKPPMEVTPAAAEE